MTKSKIKSRASLSDYRIAALPFAVCALALFCCCNSPAYAQDKIIAVVNNEVITQKELSDFKHFMRLQLSREYEGDELEKQVKAREADLLDKLIEDRLILQEAKKSNIKIDESRVKERLNEIRKYYASEVEFQSDLEKQGLVLADIESKIREQLLMYTVIEQKVRDKIIIKPEEITSFYNNNIKEFVTPKVRELEVVALENADLAKTFAYNWENGEKLADLAAKYPVTVDTLRATQGGELRKDIEDAVFKLDVGEITGPIKIDDKYYIFKLNNIILPRQQTLSEAQEKIHTFLFQGKMEEELAKWLKELKDQSYVKVMQN
jgi:parvulin-like peptidyl-prolyl isomerase